jgi:hypothetical protein
MKEGCKHGIQPGKVLAAMVSTTGSETRDITLLPAAEPFACSWLAAACSLQQQAARGDHHHVCWILRHGAAGTVSTLLLQWNEM